MGLNKYGTVKIQMTGDLARLKLSPSNSQKIKTFNIK